MGLVTSAGEPARFCGGNPRAWLYDPFLVGHTPRITSTKPALYQVALAIYQGVPFFAQLLVFATWACWCTR